MIDLLVFVIAGVVAIALTCGLVWLYYWYDDYRHRRACGTIFASFLHELDDPATADGAAARVKERLHAIK